MKFSDIDNNTTMILHPVSDELIGGLREDFRNFTRECCQNFGNSPEEWPSSARKISRIWNNRGSCVKWELAPSSMTDWKQILQDAGFIGGSIESAFVEIDRFCDENHQGLRQICDSIKDGICKLRALDPKQSMIAKYINGVFLKKYDTDEALVFIVRHKCLREKLRSIIDTGYDIVTLSDFLADLLPNYQHQVFVGDPSTRMLDRTKVESGRVIGGAATGTIHWIGWAWREHRVRRATVLCDMVNEAYSGCQKLFLVSEIECQISPDCIDVKKTPILPPTHPPARKFFDFEEWENSNGTKLSLREYSQGDMQAICILLQSGEYVYALCDAEGAGEDERLHGVYVIPEDADFQSTDFIVDVEDKEWLTPGSWLIVWQKDRTSRLQEVKSDTSWETIREWKKILKDALESVAHSTLARKLRENGANSIVENSQNLRRWADSNTDEKPRDKHNVLAVSQLKYKEMREAKEFSEKFLNGIWSLRRELRYLDHELRNGLMRTIRDEDTLNCAWQRSLDIDLNIGNNTETAYLRRIDSVDTDHYDISMSNLNVLYKLKDYV